MSKLLVLIDPGHGSRAFTPGKRSPDNKLIEGEWAREFADLLKNRLIEIGISATVLVTEEKDVSLSNRCLRANTINKNMKGLGYETLYVSIHCNAASSPGWSNASGWTVWVYGNGSSKSKKMGEIMAQNAKEMNLTGNRWVPPTGYNEANFYVLKNTNMPAVLCENCFMTNKDDVAFLLSDEGKKRLIDLYEISILQYIKYYKYNS